MTDGEKCYCEYGKKQLYVLSWQSFDDIIIRYYTTDDSEMTNEGFQTLCNSLLASAASGVLADTLKGRSVRKRRAFIGWVEVLDKLGTLLEERGFTEFEPIHAQYAGWSIIEESNPDPDGTLAMLGGALAGIIEHNLKVQSRHEAVAVANPEAAGHCIIKCWNWCSKKMRGKEQEE